MLRSICSVQRRLLVSGGGLHARHHNNRIQPQILRDPTQIVDYYAALGVVRETVTARELKRRYHELAKLYHPDMLLAAGVSAESDRFRVSQTRFAEISTAFEVLSNPTKRWHYDSYTDLMRVGNVHRMMHWTKIHKPPPPLATGVDAEP